MHSSEKDNAEIMDTALPSETGIEKTETDGEHHHHSGEHHHHDGEHHHHDGEHHHHSGEHHHHSGEHHHHDGEHHHHSGEHHHHDGEHHHHSGEHHHHHSSHEKKHGVSKEKKKENLKKLGKIAKKFGFVIIVALALAGLILLGEKLLLSESTGKEEGVNEQKEQPSENVNFSGDMAYIGIPVCSEEIFLADIPVRAFINSPEGTYANDIFEDYRNEEERMDKALDVLLTFDFDNIPKEYYVIDAELEVSENSAFEKTNVYEVTEDGKAAIGNLKTKTEYYYRITLTLSDRSRISASGSFRTAETPRIMSIDGARNVRDIGGWKTENGKVIKQGLLYRGAEIDGATEPEYVITKNGINEMLMELGIRSDMDLRPPEANTSGNYILGANVGHKYYDMVYYGAITSEEGMTAVRNIFSDLADPDAYPIYMHCVYGVDRTGTVCYLLGAILGMSEEDLAREYELSGLFIGELSRDNLEGIKEVLSYYEGETLREQVENYLLDAGVKSEEIESIKEIFLA